MQRFIGSLDSWFVRQGVPDDLAEVMVRGGFLIAVFFAAYFVYAGLRFLVLRLLREVLAKVNVKLDDKLVESGMFARMVHFAPIIVIKWFGGLVLLGNEVATRWLETFVKVYMLVVVVAVLSAVLSAGQRIFSQTKAGQYLPLKGIVQALRLALFLVGGILLLSALLGKEPELLLGGIGAMAAIMMLVFKDAILGLVAGVQISANQMVRVGDWIEMPKHNVDGDVVDVSLTTVKVQNWDKTISTIPTYALISESFKNWRGMSESGGRRIKRSILVDMQTVSFADEGMLEQWQKIRLLKPYLKARLEEIQKDNEALGEDCGVLGNGRRLTNIGTFRAYCAAYLRASPQINQGMTFLIRHLQPTEFGLPVEIYVFTASTNWSVYENVQADVFDHLLAIVPLFGLKVFQSPSGNDMHDVVSALANSKR